MSDNTNRSPFYQATQIASQLKTIEANQSVEEVVAKAERISSVMELNLDYIYNGLNDVLDMVDAPDARRVIEDIRDEVYRCMR
jgi:hypothetical protein